MAKKNLLILFFLFFILTGLFCEDKKFYKDAILILPKNTKLSFEWILYPDDNLKNSSVFLNIDNKGIPWMGVNNDTVFNEKNKIIFKTSIPFVSFFWTDNGILFFQTEEFLSIIPPGSEKAYKMNDGIPVAPLQAFVRLPDKNCIIKESTKNGIYFITNKEGKSFIYFLGPGSLKKIAEGSLAIAYNEIFKSDKKINSVAGNGKKTYIAIEKNIFEINSVDKTIKGIFIHPEEEILDLAYCDGIGIFYATKKYVGFTSQNTSFDFMKTPDAKLLIKNNLLYIFIKGNAGILKIKNIKDFANYKIK